MARHISTYPGKLILPSGEEVLPGGEVEISAETAKNAGVQEWIASGWLAATPSKKADQAGTSKD